LRKRGIILGILSRNDEASVRKIFPMIFGDRLTLEDFAIRRINFGEKIKNMEDILRTVNLLPESVIYIDDNPVERARMAATYPAMRIFGKYFQWTRQMLLNAPELQVPFITPESASRAEYVSKQVERVDFRNSVSDGEFLKGLKLEIAFRELTSLAPQAKIKRCIELVNKTNQWNSTGAKTDWRALERFVKEGGRLFAFSVADRFSNYGDVCVIMTSAGVCQQFVMSCRIAGLGLEHAFFRKILAALDQDSLLVRFNFTEKNKPFKLFADGFGKDGDHYLVRLADLNDADYIRYKAAA
jgi:FkbH-like protein